MNVFSKELDSENNTKSDSMKNKKKFIPPLIEDCMTIVQTNCFCEIIIVPEEG
jgi:hypothetical protein